MVRLVAGELACDVGRREPGEAMPRGMPRDAGELSLELGDSFEIQEEGAGLPIGAGRRSFAGEPAPASVVPSATGRAGSNDGPPFDVAMVALRLVNMSFDAFGIASMTVCKLVEPP